ncbi:hypothetical protein PVAND_013403 [Polypedilum vanderplanki]|uniref:Gustatory receptor n=1 Tax=Polypedilum vanderplanki TaxID=319348 RepID=A0A9J6CPD1_POLVA|nr:hypothetical protein PVAND_013403 [Polypedilum vanderplanki]
MVHIIDNEKTKYLQEEIIYAVYFFYENFFTLQFMTSAFMLRERFKELKLFMLKSTKYNQFFNLNIFGEIYHDLCDALELFNSIFVYHLIFVIFRTLIFNTFCIFGTIRHVVSYKHFVQMLGAPTHISLNFLMICAMSHMGSSTTETAEDVVGCISKIINKLPQNEISRFIYYNLLEQFMTRKLKIQSFFLTVNWNIVLAMVSTITTYLIITSTTKFLNNKNINYNTFAEIFHDLCDAIQLINSIYVYHLIPVILETLIYDIFGIFGTIRHTNSYENILHILISSAFLFVHFTLKCSIAHIGSSTTCEAKEIFAVIGRTINKFPPNDMTRFIFYNFLNQFRIRKFKFQSFFLTVNWNIVLATTSTIVTYLVITYQFEPFETKNNQ